MRASYMWSRFVGIEAKVFGCEGKKSEGRPRQRVEFLSPKMDCTHIHVCCKVNATNTTSRRFPVNSKKITRHVNRSHVCTYEVFMLDFSANTWPTGKCVRDLQIQNGLRLILLRRSPMGRFAYNHPVPTNEKQHKQPV